MTEKHSAHGRFAAEGTLTVREIESVHSRLRELIGRHDRVEIDLATVTEIDLSGIQLLLAARKSAQTAGKTVLLAQPLPAPVREALVRGGFLPPAGEPSEIGRFWIESRSA